MTADLRGSMGWMALARMPDRSVGGVLSGWALRLTLRWNEVGSWSLDLPRGLGPDGWPAPGCGLILLRDGQVVASGSLDEETFDWSADPDDPAAGPGTFTLTGDTDLARLGYRITYPNPGNLWSTSGQTSAYWTYPATGTAPAAEVIRTTVDAQAGPSAHPARRVRALVVPPVTGIGRPIRANERFTGLLDLLRKLAVAGGGLAFDVTDTLDQRLEFTVRAPADRTATARFGVELGNLASLTVRRIAPVATTALIAGQGQKAARELAEIPDPRANPAYGRREAFVDQRQVDAAATAEQRAAEYAKAADELFATAAEQTAVSAVVVDTPAVRWGRDYRLGDKVAILTPFGPVADLVRQVDIEVDETGIENITSVIGATDPAVDDPLAATVRRLTDRISQLERAQ